MVCFLRILLKGPLSGLRQFRRLETLQKMMKNAFYFTQILSSILKYLNFCADFFGYAEKRLDKEDKSDLIRKIRVISKFMICTNNFNTHIAQYVKKKTEPDNEIWSVYRI